MKEQTESPAPWEDAIVAELRAARMALLESVGFDLEKLAIRLRAEQAVSGHEVVTLPGRKPAGHAGEAE